MIVSGRSLVDVSRRVGLPELIYAGNHGLEIQGPGLVFLEPTAAARAERLGKLTAPLEALLQDVPGALVEPKGLTTSVHDRNVPSEFQDRVAQVVRDIVARDPDHFILTTGRRVWEIRPRVSWHKGQAVHWVLQHLGNSSEGLVFYIGDDRTDEDVFASLPDGVTVKVGNAPTTHARYKIPDPTAVEKFLNWLLEQVSDAGDLD
jgi:trehalose-phosphatase